MIANIRLEVFSESFCVYFGFKVVKQTIQAEKGTVDVNKVFGTSIAVHFSQLLIRGKGLTQTVNLIPKNIIAEIEFFLCKRQGQYLDQTTEQFRKINHLLGRITGSQNFQVI
jgi:hypothetical protein